MERKNVFSATGECEKTALKIFPVVSEEERGTSSTDSTLFPASSPNDPLHAPSTSTTPELGDNLQSIPMTSEVDENQYFSFFEVDPSREKISTTGCSLISPNLLLQTEKILKTLSVDIESSLKNIVKSIAMPSVIEAYKRWGNKTSIVAELSSLTEPASSQTEENTPQLNTDFHIEALPSTDSNSDLMAILQQRCLQYREMILDIAIHALIECGALTEKSVYRMASLIKRFHCLRANFWDFKNMSFNGSFSNDSTQILTEMVTDVIQSTFLRVLLEETETYIARLDMGLQLGKVSAMVLKMENETRALIALMEKRDLNIKHFWTGFKI